MKKKNRVRELRSKKVLKVCQRKPQWSNLQPDLLGEIKKRLYLRDHIRFGAVCKAWRAARHHKRPADLLPWLMLIRADDANADTFVYRIYEPTSVGRVDPTVSDSIKFIGTSLRSMLANTIASSHGWLFISIFEADFTVSYFSLLSPLVEKILTLPPLPHLTPPYDKTFETPNFDFIHAFSCNPDSPHCVYLVLHIANPYSRTISLLRHGDKEWTCTRSFGGYFALPCIDHGVFVAGVFYFLYASGQLGSYNISSGEFKAETVPTQDMSGNDIHQFFELDGEIMLAFYDKTNQFAYTIKRYDCSNKLWVPLHSLGDRSLFISNHSFYVEAKDNRLSPNSVYVLDTNICSCYSLEDGQLLQCISGVKYWDHIYTDYLFPLWIQPQPRLHLRTAESDGPGPSEELPC